MTDEEKEDFRNRFCYEWSGYTTYVFDWFNIYYFDFRNLIHRKLALKTSDGMYE